MIVPTEQIASVVAHGELLRLTTIAGHRHIITYRLKDLEARLDPGAVRPAVARCVRQPRAHPTGESDARRHVRRDADDRSAASSESPARARTPRHAAALVGLA